MTDDFALALSARAHRATETLHALIYFAPEANEEFVAIGLRPGSMPYFASRSAPMGACSPGVTTATFYNFNPAMVARHLPRAWTLATPEDVLAARLRVAERALRRLLGADADSPAVAELAELAREATTALRPEGRALYAGHAALDWPDRPLLVLWHAATLLREYRGDGHIAALVAADLNGIDALATHIATGVGLTLASGKLLRGWSDEQWATALDRLAARGLMSGDGLTEPSLTEPSLTEQGLALRAHLERETDRLDVAAWRQLGEQRTLRLIELGRQLSRVALGNGALPPGVFAGQH